MNSALRIFLIFLFSYAYGFMHAQDPYTLQYDTENGWPSNICYSIFQDQKGFIWYTSNSGLTRFDGVDHKVYKSKAQVSRPGSYIKQDVKGRIWYQTFDGYLYYCADDTLKNIDQGKPIDYLGYGLSNKYLFVVQQRGVDVFDIETLKLVLTIPIDIRLIQYSTVLHDEFVLVGIGRLLAIDNQLKLTERTRTKATKSVPLLVEIEDGSYLIKNEAQQDSILFFDRNLNFRGAQAIGNYPTIQGSTFLNDEIWVHTSNGCYTYAYNQFSISGTPESIFKDFSISSLLADRQGNLWFGTIDNGVLFAPDYGKNKLYFHGKSAKPIEILDGKIYTSLEAGRLQIFDEQLEPQRELEVRGKPYYIFVDDVSEQIMVSAQGFSIYDEKSLKESVHLELAVKSVVKLDDKYFGFAASGYSGVLKNPKANEGEVSPWDDMFDVSERQHPLFAPIIGDCRGKSVDFNTKTNELLVATNIGLFVLTPDTLIEILDNHQSIICSKAIFAENEILYLDVIGKVKAISNNNVSDWKKAQSLGLSEVKWMKKRDHFIFFFGDGKLLVYDILSDNILEHSRARLGGSVNDCAMKGDTLMLGTLNGLVIFPPQQILAGQAKPLFHINEVKIDGVRIDNDFEESINVKGNRISVRFSVLDFRPEMGATLYYRLNHTEWIPVNAVQRSLEFSALKPGEYLLQFKLDDELSDEFIAFNIIVPFWKTSWFYGIIGALLFIVLMLYFRWQVSLMRAQVKLLNEKVELEKSLSQSVLTSIKSQMNPHFFYNALNTIQAYIFTNDKQKATMYLSKFSKLTRLILEMSEKESIRLKEEIEALTLYLELESSRFQEGFTYRFEVDATLDTNLVHVPSMLIQPYVENAIKHGLHHLNGDKELEIRIYSKANLLEVTIDDNGIGRKRSDELNRINKEKHASFSTQANQKRLDVLNRNTTNKISVTYIDKVDDFGNALGTKVILYIPKS